VVALRLGLAQATTDVGLPRRLALVAGTVNALLGSSLGEVCRLFSDAGAHRA